MAARATAILAALLIGLAACGGTGMTFDKAAWAAERGNYDGESRRGAMVGALDDAGVVPGATRDQVRALLGEPDSSGPEADIWYLGRSGTGPSFENYRVGYDKAGRVTDAAVRRS